jgi:hypothetical protein
MSSPRKPGGRTDRAASFHAGEDYLSFIRRSAMVSRRSWSRRQVPAQSRTLPQDNHAQILNQKRTSSLRG